MVALRRWMCTLMILALCMSFMPGAVFAAETALTEETILSTEETTESTAETEVPTEESTEPTAETEMPTEESTEPTAETEMPTEEFTEPTAETEVPTEESTEPTEETTEPIQEEPVILTDPVEEEPRGWGLYFGQLHAHSDLSDGTAPLETLYAQAAAAGLDFFAVTDRGESLSGSQEAAVDRDMREISPDWAAGKAAAAAASNRDFVGLYGFEMCWPREKRMGHITTFNTPGFASWQQSAFSEMSVGLDVYGSALAGAPGAVSQFSHPGPQTGDFLGFSRYSASLDSVVQLLEVGTGENPYQYYTQALDYGWHVAPTCNQTNHYDAWADFAVGRTVIQADSLTEAGLYEALGNYRVYATRDPDLHIYFDQIGCRLARRNVGRDLTLQVRLYDPTDAVGTVEVVTTGGKMIAVETVAENAGELTFAVPAAYPYYYLRVTQADGDTAVTAPVWLEGEAAVGIRDFSCGTGLPVQGKPIDLSLTVQNGSTAALQVEKIEFSAGEEVFHTILEAATIGPGEKAVFTCSPTLYHLGTTKLTAVVAVTLAGEPRTYESTCTVSFRRDDMVTDILVDAAHGNAGLEEMKLLEQLAADHRAKLLFCQEEVSAEMLAKAAILLVTAPEESFSEEFVQNAAAFALHGGTVILCGRSAALDGHTSSAAELNRILSACAATMEIQGDTARDEIRNGGQPDWLYPEIINRDISWCESVSPKQDYRHISGCSITGGTWLVKGQNSTLASNRPSPVLLAWEKAGEGNLFAGGSLWLLDGELAEAKNIWDVPYANRTILEAIAGIAPPEIPQREIQTVRQGPEGEICRIRGYVTAGTARAGNRFPETIYLQDDTGGIAVTPFDMEKIAVGTALEITGYRKSDGKNAQFHPISVGKLDNRPYRFEGLTGEYRQILNNALHGGSLIQLEGIVERIQTGEDGTLTQLILRNDKGNFATVLVESGILSGSTGRNELALDIRKGQEVRAFGILHIHNDGTAVIRVRNCDEVMVIDPWPYTPDAVRDKSNPQSGDGIHIWQGLMALSGGLLSIKKRKK